MSGYNFLTMEAEQQVIIVIGPEGTGHSCFDVVMSHFLSLSSQLYLKDSRNPGLMFLNMKRFENGLHRFCLLIIKFHKWIFCYFIEKLFVSLLYWCCDEYLCVCSDA